MDFGRNEGEQVFRVLLEGTQYFLKLTGIDRMAANAVPTVVHFIGTVIHQEGKTSGKMMFRNLLRSGEEIKLFSVQGEDRFLAFVSEAKRYGVLYSVVKRTEEDASRSVYEFAIKASDAAKINRIIEKLELNSVALTPEPVKEQENYVSDARGAMNNMLNGQEDAQNPQMAAEADPSVSAATLTARRGVPDDERTSVRDKVEIARQMVEQKQMEGEIIPNLMMTGQTVQEEEHEKQYGHRSAEEQAVNFGTAFAAAWTAFQGGRPDSTAPKLGVRER